MLTRQFVSWSFFSCRVKMRNFLSCKMKTTNKFCQAKQIVPSSLKSLQKTKLLFTSSLTFIREFKKNSCSTFFHRKNSNESKRKIRLQSKFDI